MKDDRVLIDTSIWIDYFKNGRSRFSDRVDEILNSADVYVPKVVIAELIQGAKSVNEISVIEECMEAFNIVDQSGGTWDRAGRLSFSMKKKGITASLIDCYIAVIADENRCRIFSLDKHFKSIKKFIKIDLIS